MIKKLLSFLTIAAIITLAFTFYTCIQSIEQALDSVGYRDRINRPEPQVATQVNLQISQPAQQSTVQSTQQSAIQPALRLTPRSAYQTIPEDWSYRAEDAYSITITGYKGTATTLQIPNEIEGLPVTKIAKRAFYNRTNLTGAIIPNTVTIIGQEAFLGCCNLTGITIGNSVISIGAGAFANCVRLTSVTIPNRVTTINWGAFTNCRNLTSITIGSSVNYIGERAFENCNKLINVTFESAIASYSFSSESQLPGNLRAVHLSAGGGPGIYTRLSGAQVWWKQ